MSELSEKQKYAYWYALFSLGHMIFTRQEFRVRIFFSRHVLNSQKLREIKSPLILSIATHFSSRGRHDYCPVSVYQSYDSDCSEAILR